ncbi:MAG TPA: diacylglycerol kinase family protein [Acidimicrobiia bacterium]|jgi:diacylglycerol kinase family enzyme
MSQHDPKSVDVSRRAAAWAALAALLLAPVLAALFVLANVVAVVCAVVGIALVAGLGWLALTRRALRRWIYAALAVLALVGVAITFLWALRHGAAIIDLIVVVLLVIAGWWLARYALAPDVPTLRGTVGTEWPAAERGKRPVLLMNPRSGGGKVEQFHLVEEARRRGVEPIVLGPGDEFRERALHAVAEGADVLGAAGGDGTQAIVATVAVEHHLPFVCIPAGTRNHFALDLGVDRDDVVGSLDAFVDAVERPVDLGMIGDRVFVNNVSLGVYGEVVQAPEYRDAKVKTAVDALPDLLGPDGNAPELRFLGPDGRQHSTRQLILVSNNPYELVRLGGFGTRERLDSGTLGLTSIAVDTAADVAQLTALQLAGQLHRFSGYHVWAAPRFEVDADGPVAAGIDGEFVSLEPPIKFSVLPSALRVRLARTAPRASPAATAARFDRQTIGALWHRARGTA